MERNRSFARGTVGVPLCHMYMKALWSILWMAPALFGACIPQNGDVASRGGEVASEFVQQSVILKRGNDASHYLYVLPRKSGAVSLTSIGLLAGLGFGSIRLYRVDEKIVPGGMLPPVPVTHEDGAMTNPTAAAILGDRETELLFYSGRHRTAISFPPGTGLPVESGALIVAEIDWGVWEGSAQLDLGYRTTAVRRVHTLFKETSIALPAGTSRSITVDLKPPDGADLLWISNIFTGPIHNATLNLGHKKISMIHYGVLFHEIHLADRARDFKQQEVGGKLELSIECHYKTLDGSLSGGQCGALLYFLDPAEEKR